MNTNASWIPALLNQTMGGYRLDAFLNGGSFGLVFEATNLATSSRVAVKVLPPGTHADAVAEFDIEGVLLEKLVKCSSIVTWIDSGVEAIQVQVNGSPVQLPCKYHVLSLASGSLEELIIDPARRSALPWPERLSHWRGAIRGVHQMHLHDVAHRDLKASNCLLMLSGTNTEVRVTDLGRSKDFSLPPSLPVNAYVAGRGDARFAPPEFLWCQGGSGAIDFRNADLYGLGSLLVELATGHPLTSLAVGPWHVARNQGIQDFQTGQRRDLSVLRPDFHRAIEQAAAEIPSVIRHDAVQLIRQLCDPVPSERQPKRAPGRPRNAPGKGLDWLLRRTDILSIRLSRDIKQQTEKKTTRRSAS